MSAVKRLSKKIIKYPEEEVPSVSVGDWFAQQKQDPVQFIVDYIRQLFPFFSWIGRYNLGWLTGDLIAGITVGIVIVPQGMSYAMIATLPAQFGLYSSFAGVLTYWLFGTAKDISIGPVAVMSLTLAQIISYVNAHNPHIKWAPNDIGTLLAFICGVISLGIGLLRLGWIVEFIPLPAVSGFITGSAINIIVSQVPGLMGITGFNTRAAIYQVVINTLKGLPRTKKDAAFGLLGLFALYGIRSTCNYLTRRYPQRARLFFFINVLRNAFVLVILTVAAWLYTRHRKSKKGTYPIKILQTVPRGFKNIGLVKIDHDLLRAVAPKIPVATIILVLEHIAIGKSFGRINNYKIVPSQELVAIGVSNVVGACFGSYPATGSFSRTALKSMSGVRTPLAGIFTGIVVIVALYGLTPAFFWIPTAGLSAVIIHAVGDLVASPAQVYSYWRVNPLEFVIWWAAVLVTVFSTIEDGIYTAMVASAVLLLLRIARPRGNFLGRTTVNGGDSGRNRDVYLPLKNNGVINTDVEVYPPAPGVLVYRLEESYIYPNAHGVDGALVEYVKKHMRRGLDLANVKATDRGWNDPIPPGTYEEARAENAAKPDLQAIVLDFGAVSHIDTTGVQSLIDARTAIETWAIHPVEFHFANILSPWVRRALIAGGFGTGVRVPQGITPVIPYSGPLEVPGSSINDPEAIKQTSDTPPSFNDEDSLVSQDTPFFHVDLSSAVRAAEQRVSPSAISKRQL